MTRVTMSGAGEYAGPSSGNARLAPFQGDTFGDITEIKEGVSRSQNVTLDMMIALKEPGAEGVLVRKIQAVSGEMGGKRKGTPNIVGLHDIYYSAFTAAVSEDEAVKMVNDLKDAELDTQEIIDELQGKRVWFRIKASTATNQTSGEEYLISDVDRFLSRQEFESNAESGSHHWPNPAAPNNTPSAGTNGVTGKGVAAPAAGARAGGRI